MSTNVAVSRSGEGRNACRSNRAAPVAVGVPSGPVPRPCSRRHDHMRVYMELVAERHQVMNDVVAIVHKDHRHRGDGLDFIGVVDWHDRPEQVQHVTGRVVQLDGAVNSTRTRPRTICLVPCV